MRRLNVANVMQARYLRERLQKATYRLNASVRTLGRNEREPKQIKEWRALVSRFDAGQRRERERLRTKVGRALSRAENAARERVLFGSPEEALAAVRKFEQFKVKE